MIIGSPGAGKSTFARKLSTIIQVPIYHLDRCFWNEDKTSVDSETFDHRLGKLLEMEQWIIDGNYHRTIPLRLLHCDTVCYLDYSVDLCLQSVIDRRGKKRPDLPWVELEDLNDPDFQEFLQYIRDYPKKQRPRINMWLNLHDSAKIYRFSNRDEANEFLEEIGEKRHEV